jgi:hypothetical protein
LTETVANRFSECTLRRHQIHRFIQPFNISNKKREKPLCQLNDEQVEKEHIKLIADDILELQGDKHSKNFYLLAARKVPAPKIYEMLGEVKQSTVRSKARLFTSMVNDWAESAIDWKLNQELDAMRINLASKKKEK